MAQLNNKILIIFLVIGIAVLSFQTLFLILPTSSIKTSDPNNYLVSLDGDKYTSKLELKKGTYDIFIKTPYHTENQSVKLGYFDKKVLSTNDYETEGGVEQVTQKYLTRAGYGRPTLSDCKNYGTFHYICTASVLSSIKAVEMTYIEGNWKMNLEPASAQNEEAKNEMIKINSSGSQR